MGHARGYYWAARGRVWRAGGAHLGRSGWVTVRDRAPKATTVEKDRPEAVADEDGLLPTGPTK